MSGNLDRAYRLALALIEELAPYEGSVSVGSPVSHPAPSPVVAPAAAQSTPAGPPPGGSKMPFGKYKDWTLAQIADKEISYLSWIIENMGKDSDPKYAAKNEAFKREAAALMVARGAIPPEPYCHMFSTEAAPPPVTPPAAQWTPPPADASYAPPAPSGAPETFDDDIPF